MIEKIFIGSIGFILKIIFKFENLLEGIKTGN
jgi:hypothetical protein